MRNFDLFDTENGLSIKKAVKNRIYQLRDTLLPATCLSCDNAVSQQGVVCSQCWSNIRFIEQPFCRVFGTPFSYDLGINALSAQAIANPPAFDRARSVVLYDEVPRRMAQSLKFSDRTELAPWMAKWMVRAGHELLEDNCVIAPVPLHKWRLMGRRFNQAAELARHVAKITEHPYQAELLTRVRATRQQVGLGNKERQKNVSGAFRVNPEMDIQVRGKTIVLIDDVYTTGATLGACSRALRRKGASKIYCLTFASVPIGVAVDEL